MCTNNGKTFRAPSYIKPGIFVDYCGRVGYGTVLFGGYSLEQSALH